LEPASDQQATRRDEILAIAADCFGREGFDATKWAEIAEPAGIGETALYHYFESKNHCLFTLLARSLGEWATTYESVLRSGMAPADALATVVEATFSITDAAAIENRLLVHEQGKLSTSRASGREEATRLEALAAARRIERVWVDFLLDAMRQQAIPVGDPHLLARAVIGLLQSVWNWYRPAGSYELGDLGRFYTDATARLVGLRS
jgi:AcrR family transcriptional regulator